MGVTVWQIVLGYRKDRREQKRFNEQLNEMAIKQMKRLMVEGEEENTTKVKNLRREYEAKLADNVREIEALKHEIEELKSKRLGN